MKVALCFVLALAAMATPAMAGPRDDMSQHPRVGLLAELRFSPGSTRLPDAAGSQLGRIAAWAEENYDGLIVLDGHADRVGPMRNNLRLSLRRARLVRDQLVALGVDPNQIVISAFGADSRRHARVAIWGTRNSLDQVMAARTKDRRSIVIPPYQERPRYSPTLTGRR